jgi:hypothetical protein
MTALVSSAEWPEGRCTQTLRVVPGKRMLESSRSSSTVPAATPGRTVESGPYAEETSRWSIGSEANGTVGDTLRLYDHHGPADPTRLDDASGCSSRSVEIRWTMQARKDGSGCAKASDACPDTCIEVVELIERSLRDQASVWRADRLTVAAAWQQVEVVVT